MRVFMSLLLLFTMVAVLPAGDKVIVHHNGEDAEGNPIVEDICISVRAVDKHLANHGDTTEFEPCLGDPDGEEEAVE